MISYFIAKALQLLTFLSEIGGFLLRLMADDSALNNNKNFRNKIFSSEYQHYSKQLDISDFGYILGIVNKFNPEKFPAIKAFSDYSKLKGYIENIVKSGSSSFAMFPILYSNSSHFSALNVCLSESKVHFIYFDSIGFTNNLKDFFRVWSTTIMSDSKGVFLGYSPMGQLKKIQMDGSSCCFFSALFLLKALKCKSVQELLTLSGLSASRIEKSKELEALCKISDDTEKAEIFDAEFYRLLRENTPTLCELSPRIVKYAQTNLYTLKDFNISEKIELFLQDHTFSVKTMGENEEVVIKKHSKAIWDFRSKLLSICAKFLNENQLNEEQIVGKFFNNSDYSLT